MCGRYALAIGPEDLAAAFEVSKAAILFKPRFNIAPTQSAPVVRLGENGERRLDLLRWGLVPFWSKDESIGARLINARSETAAEKPAFRAAMKKRRCLVPMTGFFEWEKRPGAKQPYYINPGDGKIAAMAGLWEQWKNNAGDSLETYTILTTDVNAMLAHIHDRMPVILHPRDFDAWLDVDDDSAERAARLLKPSELKGWEARPVSTRVNSPRNEGESIIEVADEDRGLF